MEISLKSNHGYYIVFKAENVCVEEDVEQRIYSIKENGETDFSKPPKRDIDNKTIDQFVTVLGDLFYYRNEKYDSSYLIENLFEKLPEDLISKLLLKLNKNYEIE